LQNKLWISLAILTIIEQLYQICFCCWILNVHFLLFCKLNSDSTQNSFVCRLCFQPHDDALALATHKCARIVNESYVCPECGKKFANPANLASHRRWHKPKGKTFHDQNKVRNLWIICTWQIN